MLWDVVILIFAEKLVFFAISKYSLFGMFSEFTFTHLEQRRKNLKYHLNIT